MKKTLFISDLHLDEDQPRVTKLFFQLLDDCHQDVDALYILGDLFEAWIGDDDDSAFHIEVMAKMRELTASGIPIYLMRGNRDFLYGKQFVKKTGCLLIGDEVCVSLYGQRVLLMHGDTLCTRDVAYLKWRKKARNRFLHTVFFLSLPLSFRKKLANKLREKSRQHSRYKSDNIMDVTQEEVERVMRKHQAQILIHGHTHRPGTHTFKIDGKAACRIVLGAWHDEGSELLWQDNGERLLRSIPFA